MMSIPIFKVTFQPEEKTVEVPEGTTLREAALVSGIMIAAPCGGGGLCGKCLIEVKSGGYGPGPIDKKFIDEAALKSGYRLACQTHVRGDMVVVIPEQSRIHPLEVLAEVRDLGYELSPEVRKVYQPDRNSTAVFLRDELLGHEEGDTTHELFAMAFDIGTTTVVGALIDLNRGRRLSLASRINGQVVYGDDAISRISFAQLKEDGLRLLNEKLMDVINQIIDEVTSTIGVDRKHIYQIVCVGNTVMHHLALSIPPEDLVRPPYGPSVTEPFSIQARDLGIEVAGEALFKFLPLIGGFVGADSVALILSSQINESEDIKLAVDIGTNGEVIMGSRKRLLATSCAAGPAFEGAHIGCGMRATDGAIESVQVEDGRVRLGVIGGGRPRGICGSGLIDVVSELVRTGLIDRSGRMKSESFNLYKDETTSIDITQRDVREVQLAKAAIRAGIEILKKDLGIDDKEISEVLLAGAFGNYIRPESAARIGLIPEILLGKVRFIEDAPLRGAEIVACSSEAMDGALDISRGVRHIDLSSQKGFQEEFARWMNFP